MFDGLRKALFGSDRDLYDPRVCDRITVGVFSAWIAMGGDLLGSCMYGPDMLGRSTGGARSALLVVGVATIATLILLAWAYVRMIAHFPHGGGGYVAAREVGQRRLSLVSGVALAFDAPLVVAVSVVTCVHALGDALPGPWTATEVPIMLLLIGLLTVLNLRGVRESVLFLVPIVGVFVLSHLIVLGAGLAVGGSQLVAALGAVPGELATQAREQGALGVLGGMARAYAVSGAIYTGLEVISNSVPVLREPKQRTARRTMLLLAGVPIALVTLILAGYIAFDVRPEGGKTLNAVLFERVAAVLGGQEGALRHLLVTVPLLAEAALLVVAAQSGFVDGPRTIGALAADRFMPRRLTRLNGRLAPAPAILLIAAMAMAAILLVGGRIEPLLVVFVVCVFVTFSISQWVLMRHAARGPARRPRDAALHLVALVACLVILGGTMATWRLGSLVAGLLIAATVALCLVIHRRYRLLAIAVQLAHDQVVEALPPAAAAPAAIPPAPPPGAPLAVLLVGERPELASAAVRWLATMPIGVSGVVLASIALVDAEAIQTEERLCEIEAQRRADLERVAGEARSLHLPAWVEVRRGADIIEASTALVLDLLRERPLPSVVVGFRSSLSSAAVDALLRDELALAIQDRLARERIAMVVVSIPLPA